MGLGLGREEKPWLASPLSCATVLATRAAAQPAHSHNCIVIERAKNAVATPQLPALRP